MREPTEGDKFLDLFLLRMREPDYAIDQPYYTTGSIVAAALMRVSILGAASFLLSLYAQSNTVWWFAMLSLWGIGVYPAWMQYQRFHERVEKITAGTLCGACRHFNPTNQLCMVLDEHVTSEHPPCEGEAWEPK
ncbi:MAG: hypothetical protein NTX15_05360 [Candidatus Kapabacteria bacterium]|nr:hypothetical protein [Candidatus Kapabacteria bacterium]